MSLKIDSDKCDSSSESNEKGEGDLRRRGMKFDFEIIADEDDDERGCSAVEMRSGWKRAA